MKKITIRLTAVLLILSMIHPSITLAEDEDFSDTSYWNSLCTQSSSLTDAQKSSCTAYVEYMKQQNSTLSQKISDIDAKKDEINDNIRQYASTISSYNGRINDLNGMISDLSAQLEEAQEAVTSKQAEIDANQKAIDEKQQKIESLKEQIRQRMAQQQEGMHTYQLLDVLMGAQNFTDFIRIASGLVTITEYDNKTISEYQTSISELSDMQAALVQQKEELQNTLNDISDGKSALDNQQAELLASKYQATLIQSQLSQQVESGTIDQQEAESLISGNNAAIDSITDALAASTPTPSPSASSSSSSQSDSGNSGTSDSGNSNTEPSSGDSSGNPYYGGWSNCTWGAWQLAHDIAGVSLPWFEGNAGDWLSGAQSKGLSTGSEPRANSIVVMPYHVAYVTQVSGDSIYIKEGNYMGHYGERWVSATSNVLGYIYL